MEPSIEEIKSWLHKKNKHYAWLAGKCGVTEGRVKNWFSSKRIPKTQLIVIGKLIEEDKRRQPLNKDQIETVVCLFTQEEYELLKAAADLEGKTVRKWGEEILLEDARRHITKQNEEAKVGESPSEYELPEAPQRSTRKVADPKGKYQSDDEGIAPFPNDIEEK